MDGLGLSRILKRTMPWIRIIILSGYDEFDFAREALSIGVDEYLLKPVSATELFDVLNKVIIKIEEEKKRNNTIKNIHHELNTKAYIAKNQFLDKLLMGALSTSDIFEEAQRIDLDLIARYYVVLNIEIDSNGVEYKELSAAKDYIMSMLKNWDGIIPFFRNEENLIILLKESNNEIIYKYAHNMAKNIKEEFEERSQAVLTIGIGSITDRIGEVPKSFLDSKKCVKYLNRFNRGGVIGITDIKEESLRTGFIMSEYRVIDERLKFAVKDDIPDIVNQYLSPMDDSERQSVLFTYYVTMHIVVVLSSLIVRLGGEPDMIIPEANNPAEFFDISSSKKLLTDFLTNILDKYIDFRDSSGYLPYGDVINKARRYINEYYSDPFMSLNSVADKVALSPNHFSTVFSQETGETFIEYLTRIRIERAKELLATTSQGSAEIESKVGYNGSNYFSFLFKKHVGKSPREYRIEKQNEVEKLS